MKLFNSLTLLAVAVLSTGCTVTSSEPVKTGEPLNVMSGALATPLKVATWNIEHLAFPIDSGCKARTPEQIKALQNYAENLDADIIALQEVASKEALQQVFADTQWQLIVSPRADSPSYTCRGTGAESTQQKVAFAVKKSVPVLAVNAFDELGLEKIGLRFGLQITVNTAAGATDLLNVHMKSGCFVDDYLKSDKPACKTYAQQVPVLNNWIEKHESAAQPYLILGDFNHRLSAPYNRATQMLLNDERSATNTTAHLLGCQARYPAPIDHIIVGGMDTQRIADSAVVHPFKNMQRDAMLSDHCAVSVTLNLDNAALSSAVKWQTTSKEYQALTAHMYQQAEASVVALDTHIQQSANWVAVMDVDETILDNSAYQKHSELTQSGYTPKTWQAWVKSENATLVPGAKSFIETVFKHGGKIALITNRDKQLDENTWNNLKAVGLAINNQNTCLIGRSQADKSAVNNKQFINDKDLRRQQVTQGNADCFTPNNAQNSWQQPQSILFQVGDNIEDFSGVTQENANVDTLLPKIGKSLFLLPNPMYGSW
ncbi:endonuclease/exonuclease/phosphatase family protein [Pseudoalteromonas sp. MMG010]|uniref:HAD family acid phosphatase n=1 Tax=Pseudoalteromonas sp. MMG010 TaxID=2822685 RepID=UPI001B39DBF3|nr:HAD family acid phosphatase [Pseudoalteromonas sp. MMG010]MBQ4833609.1 endonuclease/exonuclease/phosphatase family protein [Pseudoalteromonas sp. MMG010]